MTKPDYRDIIAGLCLGAIGVLVLSMAIGYGIGTFSRMGAGFFPMLLGAAAILLAATLVSSALRRSAEVPRPSWRPLVGVAAAIAVFALSVEALGLLPAVAFTAAIAAASDRDTRLLQALVLVALLAVGSWLIFIAGLGLTIPAFRIPL